MDKQVSDVLAAVSSVLGATDSFIPLHEPDLSGNELKYVQDCIETGWVSSVGQYVDRFERDLQSYTGSDHCVATVNGTAALHLSLIVAGVDVNDEVIVPALGFVATANAVVYCHAIPHFVDVCNDTLGLDPNKLDDYLSNIAEFDGKILKNKKTGNPIRAVICMHTFGHPVDMDSLIEVCRRWKLMVIEDAAESFGSTYKNKHCGTFGDIAALSFNGNKIVTTGGGGAVLTNNKILADKAKHLSTTAKVAHPWLYNHDSVGYNYRMPNINAALGCAQIERMDVFLQAKRTLAEKYIKAFLKIKNVSFFKESKIVKSNYWLNAIFIKDSILLRDKVLEVLNSNNYMTRPAWTLLHKLLPYKQMPRMPELVVAEKIESTLINLPSSPSLIKNSA